MSQSNIIEKEEEKEFGNEVQTILYRVPKKNHDAMVELSKPFTDIFRKHGGSTLGYISTQQYRERYGIY